jgi:hypothetical protein
MKIKQTHRHSGTRAGQYLRLPEGPARKTSLFWRRQSQTTRNAFTISARETNLQNLATRLLVMTKINNHKMRAGQYLLLIERPTRREPSYSTMTITNDAQCIKLSAPETNSQKLATQSNVL